MRTLRRRRVIVPAAIAMVVVIVTGAAWYLLNGGRRMGLAVERVLVRRTGLPIKVERASWRGLRLLLRDVHLGLGPTLPIDVRVGELAIDSGILFLFSPTGRTVSLEATSASVTLGEALPVEGRDVEAFRTWMLSFLSGPGGIVLRGRRAELRSPAGLLAFDLVVERQGTGLTLGLTTLPKPGDEPVRINVRSAAALGRALDVVVDASGSPSFLAALWAGATPPAAPFALRVQSQILAGGVISSFGRFSLGASEADRQALEFTSRYDSTSKDLGISRYALAWGRDVRLSGAARLTREPTGRRLSLSAAGTAAGSKVSATAGYEPGTGAFDADVKIDGTDAGPVAQRLGPGVPVSPSARSVQLRLSGTAEARTMRVSVDPAASRAKTTR